MERKNALKYEDALDSIYINAFACTKPEWSVVVRTYLMVCSGLLKYLSYK